jgi:hypothetical protein
MIRLAIGSRSDEQNRRSESAFKVEEGCIFVNSDCKTTNFCWRVIVGKRGFDSHSTDVNLRRIRELFVGRFKKSKGRSEELELQSTTSQADAKPAKATQTRALEEVLEDLRTHVRERVAAGFDGEEDIIESGVDYLYDEAPEDTLRFYSEQFTREELKIHEAQQATWPEVTDCDRLDKAFAELEESGIVARQNFTCCQTCGNAEIDDELNAAKEKGRTPHGYTFYHMQDTESAVNGAGLYLAYAGKTGGGDVAREIIAALERHGLKPEWDGSVETRILVPIDWKRRR